MQQIAYRTKSGHAFTIELNQASVPPGADYRGFFFVVTDALDRKRPFRCVIKREFIEDATQATGFCALEPLEKLKRLLDLVEDGKGPIVFPDSSKGWEVY